MGPSMRSLSAAQSPCTYGQRRSTLAYGLQSLLLILMLSAFPIANALKIEYCASQNTGSNFDAVEDKYQSNGLCHDTCIGQYALAIMQGAVCWCSNYAPDPDFEVDTGKCDQDCPGYPDDKCGNVADKLYGYIMLNTPSGTAVGAATATDGNDTPTTMTKTTPPITTPYASVITITGSPQTITITPTYNPKSTAEGSLTSSKKPFFSNAGAVAGVFVSLTIVLLASIAAAWWFCFYKRRRRNLNGGYGSESPALHPSGRGSEAESPQRVRSTSSFGGYNGAYTEKITPSDQSSPINADGTINFPDRVRITDQRLDPQKWIGLDNGSHVSLNSVQDNQDYSRRVLRLANPDLDNVP